MLKSNKCCFFIFLRCTYRVYCCSFASKFDDFFQNSKYFINNLTKYFDKNFVIWKITIYYSLIPAYIFFGIFAATMGLLWYIGSAYFCKNDEVADYQSIHLYFTGFRGLFAPLLGIYFYLLIDYNGVILYQSSMIFIKTPNIYLTLIGKLSESMELSGSSKFYLKNKSIN